MRSHAKAPSAGTVWIAGAAALVIAFALLAISSAPAFAAPGHSIVRTVSTGPSTNPRSIAVDSDGYSYVLEQAGERIEKFDPAGNQVDFTGSASYIPDGRIVGTPAGPFPEFLLDYNIFSIAVDNSGGPNDGYLYVSQTHNVDASLYIYDSTGIYKGELDPKNWGGGSNRILGVAVNQATGELYLSAFRNDGTGTNTSLDIVRYNAPTGNPATATPTGELVEVATIGLAADSAGAVYTAGDEIGAFGGAIRKYEASQFGQITPPPSLEFSSTPGTAVAHDPNGGLFAVKKGQIFRWNETGVQQGSSFGQLNDSRGLAIGPDGKVFATDAGGGVFVFEPNEVQLPTGSTGAASNLTPSTAKVDGNVDPDGAGGITACEFRYGEDTGYSDGAVPCDPGGAISSPTAVSADLAGLVSNTTYHYRLFLTNANGTQMETGDQTFTTPAATQSVGTAGAGNVQNDSAELNGYFEGDGQDVHYFFEWGRTTAYGHTTPAPPGGDAGNTPGFQNVAPVQVSGLSSSTRYHYRIVVSTVSGITRGQDEAFTTAEAVANLTADSPSAIKDTSVELNGSYDGDPAYDTHYFFEWGGTTKYGNVTPARPGTGLPAASGRVVVPAVQINGLERGSTYHYRIVASNDTGTSVSSDATFRTAEPPSLSSPNSRNVLADSAELTGGINPNFGRTAYHFEWGPTTAYGNISPVPDGEIDPGDSARAVSVKLQGLTPGRTYHFRLVATNEYGTTFTGDQSFGFYPPDCPNSQLRQETRSNDLPDCRAYELVTPSFAQGTYISSGGGPPAPLATSPSRLPYLGYFGTFAEDTGDPQNSTADLYVSTRTDGGWFQKFIGKPATETFQMGGPPGSSVENWAFTSQTKVGWYTGVQASPDLGRVATYDQGWPTSEGTASGGILEHNLGNPSNSPYVIDTTTGKIIERWPTNMGQVTNGEHFVGFPKTSADFSHFVFPSNIPFAPGGNKADREIECCESGPKFSKEPPASIYDNDVDSGQVELVSIKGDNKSTFEGFVFNVSEDGERILMSEEKATPPGPDTPVEMLRDVKGPLYLRVEGERTWEIGAGHEITYVGSTDDGRIVYLTSKEQLTSDDQDASTDLYAWNENDPESLTRISKSAIAGNSDECEASWSGGGCSVEMVEFMSYSGQGRQGGNGSSDSMIAAKSGDVYFLSPEQLLGGRGQQGRANLYLERKGTLRFVTSLDPQAVCSHILIGSFDYGSCASGPIARMQVTPDGDHMAFVVSSNIGYDSAGHTEMYTYDPEGGRLECASCRPDGQPPTGETLGSQNGLFQTYDGRVFFSSRDPLVPKDTDGVEDVYEYTEGRPQLISSGIGSGYETWSYGEAQFAGLVSVSANGTDVYFSTSDSLVTQDHNGSALKIYDARTGGGFPAERTPEKCTAADECHGAGASPPAPPADRTSANLGKKAKAKAHKAKKHKKKTHRKKHKKTRKKASAAKSNSKQGGRNHG